MTALSDFGTLCTIAGVTGKVINVDPPQLTVGIIETTNHSSAAWREYIADGLKSAAAFTITMEVSGTMIGQLQTVWAAFTPVAIVFTEQALPAWSFNGLIKDFKLNAADAKSPTEEIVSVTIQPTSTVTIAAAAGDWYTNVIALMLNTGDYAILTGNTKQLVVTAYIAGLPAFEVPIYGDLTFASSDASKASVSAAGLITGISGGSTFVKVTITAKSTINTTIKVTDS